MHFCHTLALDEEYVEMGRPMNSRFVAGDNYAISNPYGNGEACIDALLKLLREIDPAGIHFGDHWDLLSDAHKAALRQFAERNDDKIASLLAYQLDFVLHEGVEHEDFYSNPRSCARDAYFHGKIAIWILEMNCHGVNTVLLSANLTSGQLVQALCAQLKAHEEHVSGRPATAKEESRSEEMIGFIENARAALLYMKADDIIQQPQHTFSESPSRAETGIQKPIEYLSGWSEIIDALGVKPDDGITRKLVRLSESFQGPLHRFGKGSKPQFVVKAQLITWWNSLKDSHERKSEQREQKQIDRDAMESNILDYGNNGNYMPDIAGQSVDKLRRMSKPRRRSGRSAR